LADASRPSLLVLVDLTGGDLEKVGFPFEARKRVMKAIADFGSSASSPRGTQIRRQANNRTRGRRRL